MRFFLPSKCVNDSDSALLFSKERKQHAEHESLISQVIKEGDTHIHARTGRTSHRNSGSSHTGRSCRRDGQGDHMAGSCTPDWTSYLEQQKTGLRLAQWLCWRCRSLYFNLEVNVPFLSWIFAHNLPHYTNKLTPLPSNLYVLWICNVWNETGISKHI